MADHVLDNVIWHALTGPQRPLALGAVPILRFDPAFAPFAAMPAYAPSEMVALQQALPAGAVVVLFTPAPVEVPVEFEVLHADKLVQMLASAPMAFGDGIEMVRLTPADVPAMQELVALTQPGPFAERTVELGAYYGIRQAGTLVAMAGERLRPAGHVEVSAVCTHPDHRGRGYAKALVSRVARGIVAGGATPFLHVRPENAPAIATYQGLRFIRRRLIELTVLQKPAV